MRPATEKDYHERIVRTLVYMQQRLDDDLTLEEAAGVAAFSAFHFHRVFRGLVGEPFKEHIRCLRLERAAQRLKRLDEPVTGLALDAGFETHEAFTRAFKAMFGTSPSDYRAAHKPAPDSPSGTHFEETGGWLPKSGYRLREAPAFDEYLNSPQNTKPEDLLTRIHLPLE